VSELQASITAIGAVLIALANIFVAYKLAAIHKLTNSNFKSQQELINSQAAELRALNKTIADKLDATKS